MLRLALVVSVLVVLGSWAIVGLIVLYDRLVHRAEEEAEPPARSEAGAHDATGTGP